MSVPLAFIVFILIAMVPLPGQTERPPDKKAILIGINCYDPNYPDCAKLKTVQPTTRIKRDGVSTGDWRYWKYGNLEGAINDLEMMKSVLEADPHNFQIPADAVLKDEQATADAILYTLRKYLITDAREGDLRVVYYSGHGNYVRNTAVTDPKDFDETIVPSDHWRGTPDIRDKELSRILAEAGKKVKIVFIADSCHSGSLSRGPGGRAKTALAGSADDPNAPKVEDKPSPVDPVKAPHGVIFLSAARRDQPALETEGRSDNVSDPFTGPHGAFTWALKQAFDGYGNAPVDIVFQRAAAFLAIDKPAQVPNIEGLNRSTINLFGEPADGGATQRAIVESVSESGELRLRGGSAVGIYEGTELKRASKGAPIEIRVTKEDGLAFSIAKILEHGSGSVIVRKGDLFEVDKWVVPSGSMLDLYIAPSMPVSALNVAAAEFAKLRGDLASNWIEDETVVVPTHVIEWNGKAWTLDKYGPPGQPLELGAAASSAEIKKRLPRDVKLLVVMPPSTELLAALPFGKSDTGRIRILKAPTDAIYWLRGRLHNGGVEYAWIRPEASVSALRTNLASLPLPVRSDWIASNVAADLADKAYRLGRLREWQMLRPAGPAKDEFPYHLAFREEGTDHYLSSGDVFGGKRYKMYLRAADADLTALHHSVVPRYTYVFAIDQYGKGTLIFPPLGRGNQDNLFPAPVASSEAKQPAPPFIAVSGEQQSYDFEVGEPYGTDTYFLLTSLERIDNPDMLEFDGVRSRGAETRGVGQMNPLSALLSEVGTTSRGTKTIVPTNWSIERAQVHSKAPVK